MNNPIRNIPGFARYNLAYSLMDRLLAPAVTTSDTIIISGFWRSGTTWALQSLARLLGAKTVFEPFHPNVRTYKRLMFRNQEGRKRDFDYLTLFMPFQSTLQGTPLPWHRFLISALASKIPGRWIRQIRTGFVECLHKSVVLKCIRGQLLTGFLHKRFGCPVIHIHRDPRAVTASLARGGWVPAIDHFSLKEHLLDPDDGRGPFFTRWADEIHHFDRSEPLIRMLIYWALTEKFIDDQISEKGSDIFLLSYEFLTRHPEAAMTRVLDHLGREPATEGPRVFRQSPSPTTAKSRAGLSAEERISGWTQELPRSQIDRIEAISRELEMEHRLQV